MTKKEGFEMRRTHGREIANECTMLGTSHAAADMACPKCIDAAPAEAAAERGHNHQAEHDGEGAPAVSAHFVCCEHSSEYLGDSSCAVCTASQLQAQVKRLEQQLALQQHELVSENLRLREALEERYRAAALGCEHHELVPVPPCRDCVAIAIRAADFHRRWLDGFSDGVHGRYTPADGWTCDLKYNDGLQAGFSFLADLRST